MSGGGVGYLREVRIGAANFITLKFAPNITDTADFDDLNLNDAWEVYESAVVFSVNGVTPDLTLPGPNSPLNAFPDADLMEVYSWNPPDISNTGPTRTWANAYAMLSATDRATATITLAFPPPIQLAAAVILPTPTAAAAALVVQDRPAIQLTAAVTLPTPTVAAALVVRHSLVVFAATVILPTPTAAAVLVVQGPPRHSAYGSGDPADAHGSRRSRGGQTPTCRLRHDRGWPSRPWP